MRNHRRSTKPPSRLLSNTDTLKDRKDEDKILIHGKSIPVVVLHKSPNPVLALDGRFGTLGSNLLVVHTTLARCLEEQTGTLALLQHMAQVTSVRRISVVLNVLSAGRVGKSVLEVGTGCKGSSALNAVNGICVALEDARDGGLGVVASSELAASGLDGGDGRGTGAADDDFDGGGEFLGAAGEQLDAVLDAVDAARLCQFLECDGFVWIQTAGVDPGLKAVDVERSHFDRVPGDLRMSHVFSVCLEQEKYALVLETSFTRNNDIGCLTTIEVARDLSVGLLTLVTTS
jgi:hypothetical protein